MKYVKEWLIVELKFANESLNPRKLFKMLGYFAFFCERKDLDIEKISEVVPIIVSARKPAKLFKKLKEEKYTIEKIEINGIYKINFLFVTIMVVVLSEIPVVEEFLPLLLFSQGKKLKETLKFIFSKEKNPFISWSYILYQREVIEIAKATGKGLDRISLNVREAIMSLGIRNVINDIGLKKVMEEIGIKEVIKEIGIKEVIKEIGIKEVIKEIGIEELLKESNIEDVIAALGAENIVKHIDAEILKKAIKERK
ncbi:MAG: hypothetical protein ACTSYD_08570 [Candidatus Heimdallarchaeaceae archaeon]